MTAFVNQGWVTAVADGWAAIRELHPEVPAVRLALGHQSTRSHRWAHYRTNEEGVADELFLGYDVQTQIDGAGLMGVLVHEATHALGTARGIVDCTSQGRWHNERFHQLAAETGVMLSPGRPANLGGDVLNPLARRYYAARIKELDRVAGRQHVGATRRRREPGASQ